MAVIFKRKRQVSRADGRQVERQEVDGTTQYTLEGARDHGWRECRVVEVSRDGVGLVLSGTTPDELGAHRVIVALDVPRASLRLRGEIRHLDAVEDGGVCVGLGFAALSGFERDVFASLLETSSLATTAA